MPRLGFTPTVGGGVSRKHALSKHVGSCVHVHGLEVPARAPPGCAGVPGNPTNNHRSSSAVVTKHQGQPRCPDRRMGVIRDTSTMEGGRAGGMADLSSR